jgi:hypothetical protein
VLLLLLGCLTGSAGKRQLARAEWAKSAQVRMGRRLFSVLGCGKTPTQAGLGPKKQLRRESDFTNFSEVFFLNEFC